MANGTCTAEGCGRVGRVIRGLCKKHYRLQRASSWGTCVIKDCVDPVKILSRGWCSTHYQRWQKTGDPLGLRRVRPSEEDRFWSKVDRGDPTVHWDWLGPRTSQGYGIFFVYPTANTQVNVPAHRYAYEQLVGPIPEGLVIDHLCRRPSCCNPAHMEVVTQRVNALRGINSPTAINAAKTHCVRDHPFDEANTHVNKKTGARSCRTCGRERQARYKQAKRASANGRLW